MLAMAQKRSAPRAPRTSTHALAVLVEEVRQQNHAILEGIRSSEARILRVMDERFQAFERRLAALEAAVRQNSEEIRKNSEDIRKNSEDIRKNSEDIARLQAEVRRLDTTLQGKIDQSALDSLERRVSAIEARLGIRPA